MTGANWKDAEREVARRFGTVTTRNTRPGTWEDAGDIALMGWCIDVKAHDSKRWAVRSWWESIETKARAGNGDRPALVLKRPGLRLDYALVVVRLGDVSALADRLREGHQ